MLHIITDITDPLCQYIKDDPVRPELPMEFRVNEHGNIFALVDADLRPQAIVCVRYMNSVPRDVHELAQTWGDSVAVFYTIWSYAPGSGRDLIMAARSWLQEHRPEISNFVTLSPPTDMARKFHLRNGADILSVNTDTVNYIYR